LSYHLASTDENLFRVNFYFERFIMDSKTRLLVLSVIIAVILWLLGGFVVGHALGIVFVFLSVVIVGLATGNLMNTPCPTSDKK
jgi:hypothetical protein